MPKIMQFINKVSRGGFAIIAVTLLAFFSAGAADAGIKPGASYAEGNMTMEAKNVGLADLLQEISRTAGVDIFVTKGFQPDKERLTMKIYKEPLEDVFKSLLKGFNYAAIYAKEGNDFRISAIKIYGEGQQGGDFVPLFRGSRTAVAEEKNRSGKTVTVLVNTEGDIVRRGDMTSRKGVMGPAQTENPGFMIPATGLQEPWFALQLQSDQDETERFADMLLLKKQVQATTDPQKKQALALVYADEASKFEQFKRANQTKIESLKRVGQFQAIKGN